MNRYRVKPGNRVDLSRLDPDGESGLAGGKAESQERLPQLSQELRELQEILYADHKHKILIILQAMDTGGKDGTIRHVFEGVNPQGLRVAAFKQPTPEELDRDFLWRVHKQVPGKGEIVIFNRSHYEDVLVVRVHDLAPKEIWSRRYEHINGFGRMLGDEGTTILKFFLHIDQEEQKRRLQARLEDPHKHWKFNPADLEERKLWPEYMKAYEEAISKTSTDWAPWHIVPANRKWYRDVVVSTIIIEALARLNMSYPKAEFDPAKIKIE
jgi:PPK2 family polyphosphate:nucleotide phosphotransferase